MIRRAVPAKLKGQMRKGPGKDRTAKEAPKGPATPADEENIQQNCRENK
jgi:hypothetical protein